MNDFQQSSDTRNPQGFVDRLPESTPRPPSIILFDGACNLCNVSVRFIIARDTVKRFYFASRESAPGCELIKRYHVDPLQSNAVVLIKGTRVYLRSTAALRIARELRWPWPLLYGLIVVPRPLRDWVYNWIAANRYRWFGKSDACFSPSDSEKNRFLS